MNGDNAIPSTLRFGAFAIDRTNRTLMRDGRAVEIGNRYFDALVLLAENAGALVGKDRFMAEVWAGIPVTDEALTQCIRTLRRALDDDAGDPRFIQTVPKHGYRFVAEVTQGVQTDALHRGVPTTEPQSHSHASRIAGATTIGGLMAGIVGGIFYGIAATTGGTNALVTVLILTASLALLGGAGIGAGIGIARVMRPAGVPGASVALIVGGAAGGAMIGALGATLGVAGLQAITGASSL